MFKNYIKPAILITVLMAIQFAGLIYYQSKTINSSVRKTLNHSLYMSVMDKSLTKLSKSLHEFEVHLDTMDGRIDSLDESVGDIDGSVGDLKDAVNEWSLQ